MTASTITASTSVNPGLVRAPKVMSLLKAGRAAGAVGPPAARVIRIELPDSMPPRSRPPPADQYVLYATPRASFSVAEVLAMMAPVVLSYTQPLPEAYAATKLLLPLSAPTGRVGIDRM